MDWLSSFLAWGKQNFQELYVVYLVLGIPAAVFTLVFVWLYGAIRAVRRQLRYHARENLRIVAFEGVRFRKVGERKYAFDIIEWCPTRTLSELFNDPKLEDVVERAARDPKQAFLDLPAGIQPVVMGTLDRAVKNRAPNATPV